ncbi:MAG TPA: hypothetical protein VLK30_08920 [Candidatus Limnocylindrales bacterium]|nr:hypothetical protein [Candidatus Limnocylindrales bacterium]
MASIGPGALSAIAAALWLVVEVPLGIVAVVILVFQANDEYYARGSVGYESISTTAISIPVFLFLLLVPLAITTLVSANVRRYWWVGSIAGGGLPSLVTIGAQRWSVDIVSSLATSTIVVGLFVIVGWGAYRFVSRRWVLSADGQSWVKGGLRYPTLSDDGRWRWDGTTWLPVMAAG